MSQTLTQGGTAGRQYKDRHRFTHQTPHLLGTMPVDFENYITPGRQLFTHPLLRSAVLVAEHFGVFQKLALFDQLVEGIHADEIVVLPAHFTGAPCPGGMGYRYHQLGVLLQQRLDQTGLAGARGGGKNVQSACELCHCCCPDLVLITSQNYSMQPFADPTPALRPPQPKARSRRNSAICGNMISSAAANTSINTKGGVPLITSR